LDEEKTLIEELADKQLQFKKNRAALERIYSDDRTLLAASGSRKAYYDSERVKTREQLIQIFKENLSTVTRAGEVSETLVATNGMYAAIIQYLSSLPIYRYTVIPSLTKKAREAVGGKEKYGEIYNRMISVVDGISLEVTLPKILQAGLIYGIIYIYADQNKASETIETILLPQLYCKKGYATNFGTDTVLFDFKFFDDMKMKLSTSTGSSGIKFDEKEWLELWPDEMIRQYKAYLKKPTELRWQQLDPKVSASISFSPNSMPPQLAANFGIIDYEIIKKNEITRSMNELEKILVHEIPHTSDGALMFEYEEVVDLHSSMAKALSGVNGLKLLTSFGKTELIELQGERSKENKSIQQAYDSVFYSAGLNPTIFSGDSKESLEASLQRDSAYVFKQIDLIVNFYNLAVNNLYNFSPYEAHINMLRISNYDEKDKVEMYISNANFGIGKLEAVVAAGIKQKDIADKHKLEQFLELDKILVPLQSAYTTTPSDVKEEEETDKPTSPGKEEVPDDENVDGT